MKRLIFSLLIMTLGTSFFCAPLELYAEKKDISFVEDGFILNYNEETDNKKIEIAKGNTFKRDIFGTLIFNDKEGNKQKLKDDVFIHYNSGAMSATSDSVFILANTLKKENGYIEAYYIKENEVISSTGEVYYIDNSGETVDFHSFLTIDFDNFIWKMNDNKFMVAAKELIVNINGEDINVSNFVEVEYIDEGVIQIQTEDNIWKTISSDAVIKLGEKVIHLGDKLVTIDEEVVLSLNKITISSEDNIVITPSEKYKKQLTVPKISIKAEDGIDGEDGADGELGTSGDSGSTGGTGSVGGSGGSGTQGNDIKIYPVFYIKNWQITANSLTAVVAVEDEQAMLSEDENAIIQIVRADTHEVVYEQVGENGHNFGVLPECTIETGNILLPDQQYVLKVRAKYLPIEDGALLERDFVYKKFFTDSSGLYTESTYSSTNSVSFDISHKNYSSVTEVTSYLFDDYTKAQNFTLENANTNSDIINQTVTSFNQNVEQTKSITFSFDKANQALKSNTNYFIRLVAKSIDSDSLFHDTLNPNIIQLKTLKKEATIGDPIVTQNKITYSFDFKPSFVDDVDLGIEEYVYEIYAADKYNAANNDEERKAALVTIVRSNSKDSASLPIDGTLIQTNVNYIAKLYARFNNNQNVEIVNSPNLSPEFAMAGVSMPTVSFIMDSNDSYDATGRVSKYHDRIVGSLVINTENASILVDDVGHPLILTVEAPGDYLYEKQYTDKEIRIEKGQISITPVLEGLKKASQYKFTVSGYVDLKDGTYNSANPEKKVIGSYVISTAPAESIKANWKNSADSGTSIGVYFSAVNDNSAKPATYEMDTSSRIVFNLYEGSDYSKKLIGTYPLEDKNSNRHESEFVNGTDHKIYNQDQDPDFNGLLLTEKSFGLTSGALSAYTYTIEVEGLYDYTVSLVNDPTNISGYTNKIPVKNNEFVVTKRNAPPDLPKQNEGVKVYPITNLDAASWGGVKDNYLADDVVVGYRLEATYDNSAKLGRTINFYVFENTLFTKEFNASNYESEYSKNEIFNATGGKFRDPVTANAYLFKTPKLNFTNNGFGQAPQVIIFTGDAPAGQSSSGVNSKGNNYYYTGAYNSTSKQGVSRGMQLKFAYTAELSLSATTTPDSFYPYVKNEYSLYTYHLPTSQTIDLPKADPLVYAFPWNMNAKNIVWKYFIFDVDNVLSKTKAVNAEFYDVHPMVNSSIFMQNNSTEVLPGMGTVTEADLACKVGNDYTNACLALAQKSDLTGVNDQIAEEKFKYLSIPVGALDKNSKTNLITTDVNWYLNSIYPTPDKLDINSSSKKVMNTTTSLYEISKEMSLFNIHFDKDMIASSTVRPTNPQFDISVDLSRIVDNIILFNVQGEEESMKKVAGIQAIFTSKNNASLSIRLSKSLENVSSSNGQISGTFSINTSEIALLVNNEIQIEVGLLRETGRYGFGVNYEIFGIRDFTSYGNPGEYYAFNDLQDRYTTRSQSETMPVLGSVFRKVSFNNNKNQIIMNVTDSIRNTTVSFPGTNFANLYANLGRTETKDAFKAPYFLINSKYYENKNGVFNSVLANFTLSNITPTIKVNPANGIKVSLNEISLSITEISGAKDNVLNNKVYFELLEEGTDGRIIQIKNPATTGTGNYDEKRVEGFWDISLDSFATNKTVLFSDLEIGKSYQIKPYVIMNDGTMLQLIDANETTIQKKAIYYAKTSSNVQISRLNITKVSPDYFDKRVIVTYSLDQTIGFEIKYNLYTTDDLGNKKDLLLSKYHESVYAPISNQMEFKTGPGVDSEVKLEAGKKYYIEIIAYPKLDIGTVDESKELGRLDSTFEMTSFSMPIAYSSSLPKLENGIHSLNFKLTISDFGRFLRYDTSVKGDYYVTVKDYNDQTKSLFSGYYSSIYPNSFDIGDLNPNTTYLLSVYAVADELGIGIDEDGNTLPDISKIVEDSKVNPAILDDYLIHTNTGQTMNNDGVNFGTYRLDVRNNLFFLNFSQAVGIDKITKIECSLSYISNNVVNTQRKEIEPNIVTLDQSLGAYSIELPFDRLTIESNYNITLKLYDSNNKLIKTISESIYYKP